MEQPEEGGAVVEEVAAIANVTRLLAKTDDVEMAGELVAERRAMRAELAAAWSTSRRDGGSFTSVRPAGWRL